MEPKDLKEHIEVEFLKSLTYTEINKIMNKLYKQIKELESTSGANSQNTIHSCGNGLTEKEVFYDYCLKCNEYLTEEDGG